MSFDNLSLLVSSFDPYAACWQPFCHGLRKYWPDHPQLYFITNHLDAPAGTSIKVGADRGWARNLQAGLAQIPTDFVVYSQEDYWIQNPVDTAVIDAYLTLLQSGSADYIRLYPAPPPGQPFTEDDRLGVLARGARYRTSLQMALWRKQTLLDLLVAAETPWQFEMNSPARSEGLDNRYLCVRRKSLGIDYVFTAIVNGYWSQLAFEYAEREQIEVDFASLRQKPRVTRMMDGLIVFAYRLRKRLVKQLSASRDGSRNC